jgi:pimeloyl-ACP methyl ester carboxylesterase
MCTDQDSHEHLQQMAHRAGLHLSAADLAFATSFRPYRANQRALSALQSSSQVQVTTTEEQIVFLPRAGASVGLIFYPGARVEAEAYAVFLHEIARWGYATFAPKLPLGLAVFGQDRAATLISASPAIQRWVLGGHSMGGGVACDFVATHPNVSGLLLYGTFCGCELSHRRDLAATLIYGTHDAVITPAQVISARSQLPAQTRSVAIEGGIHSFFGDYGPQEGDGQAALSREEARVQILQASHALLQQVEQ